MYSSIQRLLIYGICLAALLATVLVGAFFSISMISFQKAAMIVPVTEFPPELDESRELTSQVPDIEALVARIPYQNGRAILDILPRERFYKTIESGYGNCSNLSFGMAYLLLQRGYRFQIVHLIPYNGFLIGNGHTLLNMPYQLNGQPREGLVDVMEGGLPVNGGNYLDLSGLQSKHLIDTTIFPLNSRKDNRSIYYGEFLDNAAVGIVNQNDIARYFSFVEYIYFPLGSKRLERIVFSGVAIVFGYFPPTYVTTQEYSKLYAEYSYLPKAAQLLLWLLRLLPCMFALLILMQLQQRIGQRVQARKMRHPKPVREGF